MMKFPPFISHSAQDTCDYAAKVHSRLKPGSIIALHGDLGSGKTCFVRGLATALGITTPITSPTFALIQQYESQPPLYHMDLYRIANPDTLDTLGLEEYLDGDGIVAIEWPERAGNLLPENTIHIYFDMNNQDNTRIITLKEPII